MAKKVETRNEWRKVKGPVKVRRAVRAPWLEFVIEGRNGKPVKVIGKVVDEFISESWDKDVRIK